MKDHLSGSQYQIKDEYSFEEAVQLKDPKCENSLICEKHSYDHALELTGNGKFQWAVLLITGVSMMVVVTEGHCMSYVLPAAKCDLNMSTGEQGFTNAVGYIGVILASHFWGFMADTWGRRKVLRTALLLSFVTALSSSFSLNSWMLMILRFVNGLSVAGIKGTGITYLSEFMTNKNRPRFLSFLICFMALTVALQPLLGMFVLTQSFEWRIFNSHFVYKPWRMFVLLNSLMAALGTFGLMLLPESPKFQLAIGKPKDTLESMRKMYAWNTGKSKKMFPVQSIAALNSPGRNLSEVIGLKGVLNLIWNQTKPLFYPPHLTNMLMTCGSSYAFFLVAHGQEMWYPQILIYYSRNIDLPNTMCEAISLGRIEELSATVNTTKYLMNRENSTNPSSSTNNCNKIIHPLIFNVTVAMGVCFVAFNTILGLGVNRFGKKNMLISWLMISMLSAMTVIWTNIFYVNTAFMILLISTVVCSSVVCGVFGDLFPTHLRAMAMNMIIMSQRLGSVSGSNYVAAMLFSHCTTMLGINVVVFFGAICLTFIMLRKCEIAISI